MFSFDNKGSFDDLEKFLKKNRKSSLDPLGQKIVAALKDATPKDSGETADSWDYIIKNTSRGEELEIINTNVNDNVNIAIIIHYGHGTGTEDMFLHNRILILQLIRSIRPQLIKY